MYLQGCKFSGWGSYSKGKLQHATRKVSFIGTQCQVRSEEFGFPSHALPSLKPFLGRFEAGAAPHLWLLSMSFAGFCDSAFRERDKQGPHLA